ncbi:MAG: hypothetical protein HY892_02320 [Deltaproteobacteria bacterium]|nr:hypothetical protein [Deltaproteobacteria bacterium]
MEKVSEEALRESEERRQAQKMEAIGTLAGGIARDFNNILTAILGYTELALLDIPQDTPAYRDLSRVIQAGQRAKELVGQILVFTRKEEPKLKPIFLSSLVKEALKLMRALIPNTIAIDLDLDPEEGMVVAEPIQIHQVILNLCTNGAQAMQHRGGTITIRLSRVYLAESIPAVYARLAPGSYARLSISDNGPGMEGKILDRIFDPYFTTKEKGQGTGLGLSTVMGILKSHRGAITVESEVGRGSRFNVFLPTAEIGSAAGRDAVLPGRHPQPAIQPDGFAVE